MFKNIDGHWKQYTEENKLDRIKTHTTWFCLYARPRIGNHALSERSGFQSSGREERGTETTANKLVISYWSDENVLK